MISMNVIKRPSIIIKPTGYLHSRVVFFFVIKLNDKKSIIYQEKVGSLHNVNRHHSIFHLITRKITVQYDL